MIDLFLVLLSNYPGYKWFHTDKVIAKKSIYIYCFISHLQDHSCNYLLTGTKMLTKYATNVKAFSKTLQRMSKFY